MKIASTRWALLGAVAALPLMMGAANEAQAQSAPGGGSFPGSFLVPGTNTSFRVGGYAKLDVQIDHSVHEDIVGNGAGTAPVIAILPLDNNVSGSPGAGHGIHGVTRIGAQESRFNVETRTPTAYGEFKTFIEGDFEGVSGVIGQGTAGNGNSNTLQINSDRTAFALRHAYGTLGPLLAGQYFSLFEDLAAAPETLDFGGAIATAGPLRLPQVRYVYDMGHGLTLAGSAENPQTVMVNAHPTDHGAANNVQPTLGSSTFGLGQGDKIPDFVGAVIFSQGPGHIAFRAVARELYAHNPTTANITNSALAAPNGTGFANQNASTFGWGAGISGDYHVFGKDDILGEVNGGYGIGRYITNTGNTQADSIQSSAGNSLTAVPAWAAGLAYQHWWTDNLRSTAEGSVIFQNWQNSAFAITGANAATIAAMNSNTGQFGSLTHREISTHINLIWSPVPAIDLGYEFIWEQRKIEAGNSGQLVRSQMSAKFKF